MAVHRVQLMVRTGCGSCVRVEKELRALCSEYQVDIEVRNVEENSEWGMEFGDRVPVVLVDEEEISCWEIDEPELRRSLEG